MSPLYCVRTSNFFQIFIVLALFYIHLRCFQFTFTEKKTKEKSKHLFMSITSFCGVICLHFWEVNGMWSCENQSWLYIACSLDYAQVILKQTSSEAYTNVKFAEQLRKRNEKALWKSEKKKLRQMSPLPILLCLVALQTSNANAQGTVQIR